MLLYLIQDTWRRIRDFGKADETAGSEMVPI
jgi:hypothetical protein